jgi:hypothetical protein
VRAVISNGFTTLRARDWKTLVGTSYPFLRREFLLAAE